MNPVAARCWLPGFDESAVVAFNAQYRGDGFWQIRQAPDGWSADLHGAGIEMVGIRAPPAFGVNGSQAVVAVEVSRNPGIWGHPEARMDFDILVLLEKQTDGTWMISRHAVFSSELK